MVKHISTKHRLKTKKKGLHAFRRPIFLQTSIRDYLNEYKLRIKSVEYLL